MKTLIISDVHGNAEALSAVLEKERDADTTVFLGDSVSPGPQPNETMALLQGLSGISIMGNHDVEMLEPERFANWPASWLALYDWIFDVFDPAGYEYLRNMQPGGEYEVGGIRMCLQHGTLPGKTRHALPETPDEALVRLARGSNCPYVLFGHSHVQFRRTVEGQEFINPGSVGQNRCGKLLACYGVFEDGVFHHRQVEFDPGHGYEPWTGSQRLTPTPTSASGSSRDCFEATASASGNRGRGTRGKATSDVALARLTDFPGRCRRQVFSSSSRRYVRKWRSEETSSPRISNIRARL